jgi:hypothetical protein
MIINLRLNNFWILIISKQIYLRISYDSEEEQKDKRVVLPEKAKR